MISKAVSNQKGFTLIEIMIAIVIFSIGMLAIAKLQITATEGNSFARKMSEAANIAQDRTEEILSMGYDLYVDFNGNGANGSGLDDTGVGADYFFIQNGYAVSINVSEAFPISNTKTIRIIIKWAGNTRHTSIDYIKFDQI
jgi:prepilin-type N-terminal cleavage/methylation domain-containing protein